MKTEAQNFSWLDIPKTVWYFLAEDRKRFTFYFIVLSIIFLYDLVPAYVVGKIVDFFSTYRVGDSLSTFYFYIIFIAVTWIISSMIRLKSKVVIAIIAQNARTRARIWGFERLTEFSLEWHNKENTGSKLQKIYTGSDAVAKLVAIMQKDLLRIGITVIGVISFFLFYNFKIFCLVTIYTITFFLISSFFGKKIFVASNAYNMSNQDAGGTFVESASNMLSIKALGGEKGIISRVQFKEALS